MTIISIIKQQGAAMLATCALLLTISSISALSTAISITKNQQVIGNELKVKQAFEAAESGLEFGVSYIKDNASSIVVDSDNNGYLDPYTTNANTNVAQANGTTFSFSYVNPNANNFDVINLTTTGTSSDNSTTRTITQQLLKLNYLQNLPPAGFIAHQNISLGGNVTITNSENGNTIWAGGNVSLSGSAGTNCGPGCGSNKKKSGNDITENDANLSTLNADQFFYSFFNSSKTEAKQKATLVYTNSVNTNYNALLDGVEGEVIWLDHSGGGQARINSNTTIGSMAAPVILIIDGDFKANGGATIYGAVYVIGDWHNSGGGNLDIYGAAIVEGSYSGTGTPNVVFASSVLNNLNLLADFVKIPGTWRDF